MGLMMVALSACATQKSATTSSNAVTTSPQQSPTSDSEKQKLEFLNKVYENEAYQKNIVSDISFTLQTGGKNITVPGQLRMRKNEVIRIQLLLPFITSEAGRIEFAKDYVLVVDRIHKEYVKTSYDKVAFLHDNGITFYTLQALFWNKLYLPGKANVGFTDLEKFAVSSNNQTVTTPITVTQGKMTYRWLANTTNGLISQANVAYNGGSHGESSLTWTYDNFKNFGSKKFPYSQTLTIDTKATGAPKTLKALFDISSVSTTDNWETTTTLSDRYRQVSVEEVLGKLINM